jgi:hypothetical protein
LVSAPSKKNDLQRQLSDLGVQRLGRLGRPAAAARIEYIRSAASSCAFPPLMAASATFALKADVWFRRGCLDMVSR